MCCGAAFFSAGAVVCIPAGRISCIVAIANLFGAIKSFFALSAMYTVWAGSAFRVWIIFSKPAGEGFQQCRPSCSV